ncbi:hypothetical protein AB9128_12265 [Streptomyces cinereoruber]|uniref:hypothetical protein n=1 Tax=Streptomyces cinereoruber TaxID=67260 RepID=UPI003EB9D584
MELIDCDTDAENAHNTWRLGNKSPSPGQTTATAPGVLNIVLKQAAERCAVSPETTTCGFVALETPKAYRAAEGVLYNQSPDRDAEYSSGDRTRPARDDRVLEDHAGRPHMDGAGPQRLVRQERHERRHHLHRPAHFRHPVAG